MKKVLITGKNSYIGLNFKSFINCQENDWIVDELDVHGENWWSYDFSKYDAVLHVAGIAHVDTRRASDETKKLYYAVNTDLAIDIATYAKKSGVKQFVFLSSIMIYGQSKILKPIIIDEYTKPNPNSFYGDSKLQAENAIFLLSSETFYVTILRLPMIYGKGCKGNYVRLENLALKWPFYPFIQNRRSMLYIENLSQVIQYCICAPETKRIFPQNPDFVSTVDLIRYIAEGRNKRVFLFKCTGWIVTLAACVIPEVNKVFGSLFYQRTLSKDILPICKITTKESVLKILAAKNSD